VSQPKQMGWSGMSPEQNLTAVTAAVMYGWVVPDEHKKAYNIADVRERDTYHVYWLNVDQLNEHTVAQYGQQIEEAGSAALDYLLSLPSGEPVQKTVDEIVDVERKNSE
jgi:hypothetical protein